MILRLGLAVATLLASLSMVVAVMGAPRSVAVPAASVAKEAPAAGVRTDVVVKTTNGARAGLAPAVRSAWASLPIADQRCGKDRSLMRRALALVLSRLAIDATPAQCYRL